MINDINFNIICNDSDEFNSVQDILYSLGYKWLCCDVKRNGSLSFKYPVYISNNDKLLSLNFYFEEYKLKDNVYLAKNFTTRFVRGLKIYNLNNLSID